MAIINSMGVGRARKSMGNVTYRTVRGRTIGSQKRGATGGAGTRGDGSVLSRQQALFGMMSMYAEAHASDIQVSFNKTKYGSQRNYFMRSNFRALSSALASLLPSAMANGYPAMADIENAITTYATANPSAIYRVKLSGFDTVFLSGAWTSEDNPVSGGGGAVLGTGTAKYAGNAGLSNYSAPVSITGEFRAGAKIVREGGSDTSIVVEAKGVPEGLTTSTIKHLDATGSPVAGVTVTAVESSVAGKVVFTTNAITEAMGVVAVQLGGVYARLTSAYVTVN